MTNFLRASNVRHISIDRKNNEFRGTWVNFLLPNKIKNVTIKFLNNKVMVLATNTISLADEPSFYIMASFINSNRHICALKLHDFNFYSEASQLKMCAAMKNLPTLNYLKLSRCFYISKRQQDIPEHFFKALMLRGRPIKTLKMVDCYIGCRNLLNLIGLANRGYTSEQLTLDVSAIDPAQVEQEE